MKQRIWQRVCSQRQTQFALSYGFVTHGDTSWLTRTQSAASAGRVIRRESHMHYHNASPFWLCISDDDDHNDNQNVENLVSAWLTCLNADNARSEKVSGRHVIAINSHQLMNAWIWSESYKHYLIKTSKASRCNERYLARCARKCHAEPYVPVSVSDTFMYVLVANDPGFFSLSIHRS